MYFVYHQVVSNLHLGLDQILWAFLTYQPIFAIK